MKREGRFGATGVTYARAMIERNREYLSMKSLKNAIIHKSLDDLYVPIF